MVVAYEIDYFFLFSGHISGECFGLGPESDCYSEPERTDNGRYLYGHQQTVEI